MRPHGPANTEIVGRATRISASLIGLQRLLTSELHPLLGWMDVVLDAVEDRVYSSEIFFRPILTSGGITLPPGESVIEVDVEVVKKIK